MNKCEITNVEANYKGDGPTVEDLLKSFKKSKTIATEIAKKMRSDSKIHIDEKTVSFSTLGDLDGPHNAIQDVYAILEFSIDISLHGLCENLLVASRSLKKKSEMIFDEKLKSISDLPEKKPNKQRKDPSKIKKRKTEKED